MGEVADFEAWVSGAVAASRLLEAAVHDPGPWSIRFADGSIYGSTPTVEPPRVRFAVVFQDGHQPPAGTAELRLRGVAVSVAEYVPEGSEDRLEWVLAPTVLAGR